jgi:pyruvate dehydrogenase E1 component alpha subunit
MAEMFGKVRGVQPGPGRVDAPVRRRHPLLRRQRHRRWGLPLAVGLALADKMQGRRNVTACFFGEGAMAEGEFHESMNLAALWDLPVLFCCENNLYAMGTALERSESETDMALKAAGYAMPSWAVDGMDVDAVHDAARNAVQAIRAGGGPQFLELRTYRFRAHSMFDPERYRDKAEVAEWRERDPIDTLHRRLTDEGCSTTTPEAIEEAAVAEVDDAVAFAEPARSSRSSSSPGGWSASEEAA